MPNRKEIPTDRDHKNNTTNVWIWRFLFKQFITRMFKNVFGSPLIQLVWKIRKHVRRRDALTDLTYSGSSNTHVFPRTNCTRPNRILNARNYGSLRFVFLLLLPLIRPARCGKTDFKRSSLIPITFVGQRSAGARGKARRRSGVGIIYWKTPRDTIDRYSCDRITKTKRRGRRRPTVWKTCKAPRTGGCGAPSGRKNKIKKQTFEKQ